MMPMLDCDAVARQLWDFLDGELSPERLAALDEHIKMCGHCSSHLAFEQSFKAALRAARGQRVASSALGDRVRAALRRDGFVDPR
jgi:anti-sigma factor (TIGR02949 family)